MKKMTAFVMALALVCTNVPANLHVQTGTETVSVIMVAIMLFVTSKLSAASGRYFIEQQKDIGKVNAYIEEMMEGQKGE